MPSHTAAPTRGSGTLEWSRVPRWYLWNSGFLTIGCAGGIVPPHSHHAIQIVLAIDGEVGIRGARGDWRMGRGIVVRPDAIHSLNPNDAFGALLFIEPESAEGAWLLSSLRSDITVVPEARLAACVTELRQFVDHPFESLEVRALIRQCVQAVCAGAPPTRRLDERVTRVLGAINTADELRMSLDDAAASAFLSPSRFAHLFKQQVGLPFRRYMLWRKLTRAILAIGRGETLATAAQNADFADGAHLTRTFNQMIGLAPSVWMKGDFFEIVSPFEAA